MRYSYFTPNEETEALTDLMDKAIWFFELIATTEVELIKQRLRLIIKKKMKRKCWRQKMNMLLSILRILFL